MTPSYVFVGERPSERAIRMGVKWRDGRLAAKQLFDALDGAGISRAQCDFVNLFGMRHDRDCSPARRAAIAREIVRRPAIVVGMGKKVCAELDRLGVVHVPIAHPAARGRIRKKEAYAAHVRERVIEHVGGWES